MSSSINLLTQKTEIPSNYKTTTSEISLPRLPSSLNVEICSFLRYKDVVNVNLSSRLLSLIKPNNIILDFHASYITDDELYFVISKCNKMHNNPKISINLRNCPITDVGLAHLASLKKLTEVDLGWCKQITDKGLEYLTPLKQLTKLDLQGCKKVTDAGLAHLKSLTQLTELNLYACDKISDTGLAHLKALSQLTELNLWGCKQITDTGHPRI